MEKSKKNKIAIIGGGVQGLSLAFFLSKDHLVTIYERNRNLGGLLGLLEINGTGIEGFYHHWFTSHTEIIDLACELGFKDSLLYLRNLIGLFYKGRIYPFTTAWDLLKFSPLSFFDRVRLGLAILVLKRTKNYKTLENVKAIDWLKNWCGHRAYEVVWEPLLEGKFGNYKNDVSMAWFWGRIHERGNSPFLVYPRGGFHLLIDGMVKYIKNSGGVIETGINIEEIKSEGDKLSVKTSAGMELFDKVFVTTPINVFSRLVRGLPTDYLKSINQIKYRSAHVVVVVLKHSLLPGGYYWLNINDRDIPLLAVVEHTNLISKEDYGGKNIVYLGNYPSPDDPIMFMSNDEVIKLYSDCLKKINRDFTTDWIENYYVFKDLNAQPIVDINYKKSIPSHQTPIDNLYLVTMAQIYPWDRGTNNAVKHAKELIRELKLL